MLIQELQEEDLYVKFKKLSRHLEMLEIQETYVKDEQANLKRELIRAQEEVKRIQSVPLVIGQFLEAIDQTRNFGLLPHSETRKFDPCFGRASRCIARGPGLPDYPEV